HPYPIALDAMGSPWSGDKFDYYDPKIIIKSRFSSKSITDLDPKKTLAIDPSEPIPSFLRFKRLRDDVFIQKRLQPVPKEIEAKRIRPWICHWAAPPPRGATGAATRALGLEPWSTPRCWVRSFTVIQRGASPSLLRARGVPT